MQTPYLTSPMTKRNKKQMPDVLKDEHVYNKTDIKRQLKYVKRLIANNKGKMTEQTREAHSVLCRKLTIM